MKGQKKGVTLVELIIVITLIGILVILGITFFRSQALKGNDARRKSDIRKIQTAIEEYEKDHDCYPLSSLLTCSPGSGLKPYLDKVPCDPVTNASYFYENEGVSCPGWYRIYAKLDNSNDPDSEASIGPSDAFNYEASSPNAPGEGDTTTSTGDTGGTDTGGSIPPSTFYGCIGGACVPISWDISRPGPECDPNYQNPTCYFECGTEMTECKPWR